MDNADVFLIFVVICIGSLFIAELYKITEEDEYSGIVVDKYTRNREVLVGTVPIFYTDYILEFDVGGETKKVEVSKDVYDLIEIGKEYCFTNGGKIWVCAK